MKSVPALIEQPSDAPLLPFSMVCFLEELEPESLLLAPQACSEVRVCLETLARKPVLEAMLDCLERLSERA